MVPLPVLRDSGKAKKMRRFFPWILVLAVALSSCAKLGLADKPKKKEPTGPFGPSGIPPQLRSKNSVSGTPVVAADGVPGKPIPLNITPEEDLFYTNPDDPEAEIPELSTLLSSVKRGPWEDSETIAKLRSVREGKPLLIWFTDSMSSPMCKALTDELFSTADFGNWATEKLVRLRVDANLKSSDLDLDLGSTEDRRVSVRNYNAALKKRYKIMGYPSLIFLSPSGEVIGRYRGYKRGEAGFLWGQMKHAEGVSAESNKAWRAGLEKKGYREWQDRKERKIFAKLTSYSKGKLTFIEPDGTRSRAQEETLSDKDRAWIAEQKKIRNFQ
jgi:thioredoxin-related protein